MATGCPSREYRAAAVAHTIGAQWRSFHPSVCDTWSLAKIVRKVGFKLLHVRTSFVPASLSRSPGAVPCGTRLVPLPPTRHCLPGFPVPPLRDWCIVGLNLPHHSQKRARPRTLGTRFASWITIHRRMVAQRSGVVRICAAQLGSGGWVCMLRYGPRGSEPREAKEAVAERRTEYEAHDRWGSTVDWTGCGNDVC